MTVAGGAHLTHPEGEVHHNTETIYVLEGSISVDMGEKHFEVGPHEVLHIQGNEHHKIVNSSSEDTKLLVAGYPDWDLPKV
jgi:mannose-6-phosphate isomerase-like protein (cupin superfamily)